MTLSFETYGKHCKFGCMCVCLNACVYSVLTPCLIYRYYVDSVKTFSILKLHSDPICILFSEIDET